MIMKRTVAGFPVTIAGNRKTGTIPALNLPSGPDRGCCAAQCTATCWPFCYDRYANGERANVLLSRAHNLAAFKADPSAFFAAIASMTRKLPYVRIHSGREVPNRRYARGLVWLANECPDTRYLLFTKKPALFRGLAIPANLTIVISQWPGFEQAPNTFPAAWLDSDARCPEDAIPCPGACDQCGMCWALPLLGHDVKFHPHGVRANALLEYCSRF
jgi:hypothetical protein